MTEPKTPLPWNHGIGISGPYIDYQAHPDERGGPDPMSDYCGREPVWLGGEVDPLDRAYIVHAANNLPKLQQRVAELESLLYGLPPMSHGAGCQVNRGMNPCNCGLANWQVRRAALLEARNDE